MATCRFCHKTNYEDKRPMVRIASRHNAHWQCKLDSLKTKEERQAWVRALPRHQLVTAPALMLERNGLYEFVINALKGNGVYE